jgi:glycosyltransferase involved in cell wall biosynthesis
VRVAFDEQIFLKQMRGGISRYFVELINAFRSDPDLGVVPELTFDRTWNEHALSELAEVRRGRLRRQPRGEVVRRRLARRFRRSGRQAELVHSTFYDPRYLADSRGAIHVVTVHDMIPELFPDQVSLEVHEAKRQYVEQADLVVCVSEATREDLSQFYGELAAPVVVVASGVSDRFVRPGDLVEDLPNQYLLHVGARAGYKNFALLLDAFAESSRQHPDLHLVLVGGGPLSTSEQQRIAELGLSHRIDWRQATDEQLPTIYQRATAVILPSRYEGFGLPVLEAMKAGAPVIAGDTAVFREVAGEAAVFFDVDDVNDLAAVISRVLADSQLAHDLVDRGQQRAADFSWSRTARLTAEAYRGVVAE